MTIEERIADIENRVAYIEDRLNMSMPTPKSPGRIIRNWMDLLQLQTVPLNVSPGDSFTEPKAS